MQSNGAKSPLFHLRGRSSSGRALQRSDDTRSPTLDTPMSAPSASPEKTLTPDFGRTTPQVQPTEVSIEGYRPPAVSTNAAPNKRPRSSALLNINDPVAMHLLVETAIGDSRDFEVVSFDELDSLKKEYVLTLAKLESVKRKLVMESKVREAAQSLLRLYTKRGKHGSAGSVGRPKRNISLSGSHPKPGSSGSDQSTIDKTEDELAASGRKCEELAADMWKLEKRAGDIRSRILRHTAGILQLTHKGPSSKRNWMEEVQPMWPLLPNGMSKGAMPGSPESIYTYDNASRSGTIETGDEFGDRSLYIQLGDTGPFGIVGQRQSGLDAQSHPHLSTASDLEFQNQEFERHNEAFASLESRLAELNHRLRDLLLQTNPKRYQHYAMPPTLPLDNPRDMAAAETSFQQQLDYLEHGLDAVSEEHYGSLQDLRQSETAIESKLHSMNERIYTIINSSGVQSEPPYPTPPPSSDGPAPERQVNYLEEGLETVQQLHHEMISMLQDSSPTHMADQDRVHQYDAVVSELWQIVNAAEEQVTKGKARRDHMDEIGSEGAAGSGDSSLNEESPAFKADEFNLQAFSAKVQRLCDHVASLNEQNAVLNGQVEQEKGLNKSSEEQKMNEIDELREQIATLHDRHAAALHEASELRVVLGDLTDQLDAANEQILLLQHSHDKNKRDSHAWTAERRAWQHKEDELRSEAERKQERIELLEKLMADLDDDMQAAEAEREEKAAEYEEKLGDKHKRVDELTKDLEEAQRAKEKTTSRVTDLEAEVEALNASHTEILEHREKRIEELGLTLQKVRTAHGEATNRASDLQFQLEALHGSHEEARSHAMELQTQLQDKESRIDELGKTLGEARTAHEETTSRALDIQSELEALQNSHGEVTAQAKELKAQLDSVRSLHEEATVRATGLESQLEALHVSYNEAKSHVAELQTQLDTVHASHDEAAARVNELQSEVEALDASHRNVKSYGVELQAQLHSLRASRDEATAHAEDLQSQLDAANSSNTAARARAADLESQLSSLSLSHGKAMNEATNLESQLSAMKTSHHSATGHVAELESELSEANSRWRELQSQLDSAQTQLDVANSSKVEAIARVADLESQISSLNQTYTNATTHTGHLESQMSGLRTAHDDANSRAANLESQLSKLHSSHDETSTRALNLEDELRNLESELVRVRTELTVAKAELDGAYGSRAQRAAEVAANPEIRNQLDELGKRNAVLRDELDRMRSEKDATVQERERSKEFLAMVEAARDESAMKVEALEKEVQAVVAELEALVAQAVTMEREREGLEGEVDKLRARCEDLEERLEEEKIRHLGLGSMVNGEQGGPESEGRGMAALRAEFKKLMRESRMDFVRALRAEHDERRRLEATIRTLRKEQAAGRSGASQPVAAV